MSGATGFGSGGTSLVTQVGPPISGKSCNTSDPGVDFSLNLDSAFTQCRRVRHSYIGSPPPNDLHTETMCSAAITKRFNLSLPPPVLGYFHVERRWTYPRYRDSFLEGPRSSSSLGTLYIPMWRTLYQKMAINTSSNFRQRTANGEVHRRHPWLDLRSIPTTNSPHHHNTRQDTSDRQPSHSDSSFLFFRFVRFVRVKQSSFGLPGKILLYPFPSFFLSKGDLAISTAASKSPATPENSPSSTHPRTRHG